VAVAELVVVDSISDLGCEFGPLEGPLSPTASALGFLSDRLTIGCEKPDILKILLILSNNRLRLYHYTKPPAIAGFHFRLRSAVCGLSVSPTVNGFFRLY